MIHGPITILNPRTEAAPYLADVINPAEESSNLVASYSITTFPSAMVEKLVMVKKSVLRSVFPVVRETTSISKSLSAR